jgi:hypothetical protein
VEDWEWRKSAVGVIFRESKKKPKNILITGKFISGKLKTDGKLFGN